ncbi:hypothetical protein KFK09_002233 [Dendrobium nobile]|uniref:Uncharacterized protein n=1 Tax=Dendrobium nobile TaxID=94219 RepID=A0A8T3CBQ0_DENNO|nr:hypothetical protein KFK09_002233 [Dendrobium nobile]
MEETLLFFCFKELIFSFIPSLVDDKRYSLTLRFQNRYTFVVIAIRCNDIPQRFKDRLGRNADFSSSYNLCKSPEWCQL